VGRPSRTNNHPALTDRFTPRIRSPSPSEPGTARSSTSAGRLVAGFELDGPDLLDERGGTRASRWPSTCKAPEGARGRERPKASGQLAAQRSTALHIERLIDRLMRHTHRLIIGEVNPEATGDLLRAPALSPASVLSRSVAPPAPADVRTRNTPVGALHRPGQPVLHIDRPATPGSQPASPARDVERDGPHASGRSRLGTRDGRCRRSVALQLPGDRRRRTTQLTRDLTHPKTTSEQGSIYDLNSQSARFIAGSLIETSPSQSAQPHPRRRPNRRLTHPVFPQEVAKPIRASDVVWFTRPPAALLPRCG